MFLAVLDIDSAEGGRDFGTEAASIEGEHTRVVGSRFYFNVVDAEGAAQLGERYRGAAADGGI